jgi:hypothetical protein
VTETRPKRTKAKAVEVVGVIPAIKGMDRDMKCRYFQFATGETYTVEGVIKACENGFHACPGDAHPLSVFEYYAPATSRYFDVTVSGKTDREGAKIAAASITIGVEISLGVLIQRAVDWVISKAKPGGVASNSGERGAASNTGYGGARPANAWPQQQWLRHHQGQSCHIPLESIPHGPTATRCRGGITALGGMV